MKATARSIQYPYLDIDAAMKGDAKAIELAQHAFHGSCCSNVDHFQRHYRWTRQAMEQCGIFDLEGSK